MRLAPSLLLALLFSSAAAQAELPLDVALSKAAPDADPAVLGLAAQALQCAESNGMESSQRLAVIDYSLPSTEPRLWIFDLKNNKMLHREWVAHGKNSGDNLARHFSNEPGSLASSLGLFRTLETYQGKHGYSLRMDGLEPGFNDNALERAIVWHGAPYVSENFVEREGRIGRSWGCPAVRSGVAKRVIDALKGGQFVFSYYPDRKWLASSRFLNCPQKLAARSGTSRSISL